MQHVKHRLLACAGDQDLACQAQQVLSKVHARGVLHGDLNVDNFMVVEHGPSPQLFLLDFSNGEVLQDADRQAEEMECLEQTLAELQP